MVYLIRIRKCIQYTIQRTIRNIYLQHLKQSTDNNEMLTSSINCWFSMFLKGCVSRWLRRSVRRWYFYQYVITVKLYCKRDKFPNPLSLIRLWRTKIQIPRWNVDSVLSLEIWVLDLFLMCDFIPFRYNSNNMKNEKTMNEQVYLKVLYISYSPMQKIYHVTNQCVVIERYK